MRSVLHKLSRGLEGLFLSPRLFLVIAMIIVVPILLVQLFSVFMNAALEHANTAERERIGILHDVLGQLTIGTSTEASLQTSIKSISKGNNDITSIIVGEDTAAGLLIKAATDETKIGSTEPKDERFTRALISPGTPIVYEYQLGSQRMWDTVSIHMSDASSSWYILTTQSHYSLDQLLANREWYAYGLLFIATLLCVAAGYWQIRNMDYEAKYRAEEQKTAEQNQITNMIAHELRAPLTAMRGYASMIRELDHVPEQALQHALRIEESTVRLVSIVNDFLDMARIQSGQLTIKQSELNLSTVLDKVITDLTPLAVAKNLSLSRAATVADIVVKLDQTRLEQILTNLISNAIKYTEVGRVSVEAQQQGTILEIRIKDTGTGISAENQSKLFTPFFRVDNAATDGIVGTGLGMWITKRLIEAQGGTIGVESIKDVGTNMVVRFKV